jgi:hypothetical protein
MNPLRQPLNLFRNTVAFLLLLSGPVFGAEFSEWPHRQEVQLPHGGLIKLSLPAETLDVAQADLRDLRVTDATGREVPYAIERPGPTERFIRQPHSFAASLDRGSTTLLIETGLKEPLEAVTLLTPAAGFIKAVQIEGSMDQQEWKAIAKGLPVFRQSDGASQLRLSFPAQSWAFLRLTVDDHRSQPVPFSGAQLHGAGAPALTVPAPVEIIERAEGADETRLTLNFSAAHLDLSELEIQTPDALFTRRISLVARQAEEDGIHERTLAQGVIYRVAIDGQPPSDQLAIRLDVQTPQRELLLLVQNDNNPPLRIGEVHAQRRPVNLVFMAREAETYTILTGNRQAPAPRYDLAALGRNFKNIAVSSALISPLAPNPRYQPRETLPEVPAVGSALDVSAWRFRKALRVGKPGVQQLELDLEVLSHARPDFADLRLMTEGHQIPFIFEHTSVSRSMAPQAHPANDPKKPQVSRWSLKLPLPSLPITRLACMAKTPLFQRNVLLYEEVPNDRGENIRRNLGEGFWQRTPNQTNNTFVVHLSSPPSTDTLFLEMNNGDNPPVMLENFLLFHPATRVLFKATGKTPVYLYYGNRQASLPRYDLSLVIPQMLSADKQKVQIAAEELLGNKTWKEGRLPGAKSGVLFWISLALVVVVLLVVISRLLPKGASSDSQSDPGGTASK